MATEERRLNEIKMWDDTHFRTPQITEIVILLFVWTRLATLFPKT